MALSVQPQALSLQSGTDAQATNGHPSSAADVDHCGIEISFMGAEPAARSTYVYVVNRLAEDLVLVSAPQPEDNPNGSGIWTEAWMPPATITACSLEAYGCQSNEPDGESDVTNARVTYKGATSGRVYTFSTSVPFSGENHAEATPSSVRVVVGEGNNNIVTFIVD